MSDDYQKHIADHYAAYRPPIHQLILASALAPQKVFKRGLDIGCGTGYSAVALANHCQQVFAVDPSQSMLEQAQAHPKIDYLLGSGERLPCYDNQFDLISIAGSLFYIDRLQCLQEIKRVTLSDNTIVVYDFEILLDTFFEQLKIRPEQTSLSYDHKCQFSTNTNLQANQMIEKQIELYLQPNELAHVILSDQHRYQQLAKRVPQQNLFESLLNLLPDSKCQIKANIYYATYHIVH